MRRSEKLPLQYRRLLARVAAARRARRVTHPCRVSLEKREPCMIGHLPLRTRLANQFSDAMFAIEEALSMCEQERAEGPDASWIEPQIRMTYDQVNALMKAVCD
jgi:hypothetical protein